MISTVVRSVYRPAPSSVRTPWRWQGDLHDLFNKAKHAVTESERHGEGVVISTCYSKDVRVRIRRQNAMEMAS